jgi:type IV secretory pathway VirJ component
VARTALRIAGFLWCASGTAAAAAAAPAEVLDYGEDDGDSACAEMSGKDGVVVKMPGGHHFGGGYAEIAAEILSRLPKF